MSKCLDTQLAIVLETCLTLAFPFITSQRSAFSAAISRNPCRKRLWKSRSIFSYLSDSLSRFCILSIPTSTETSNTKVKSGLKVPRAISVCATGAMKALKVEDEEMKQIVEKEDLETLNPEYNTRPRVYYKNLYRYNKCFIGGSVAIIKNKIEDCISGANVKLCKNSQIIDELQTDDFGDFKFDKLPANSGEYEIEIEYKSIKKSIKLNLNDSLFLGNIYI